MSIFEEYGAFKDSLQQQIHFNANIFGTNDVVVTKVYCIHGLQYSSTFKYI